MIGTTKRYAGNVKLMDDKNITYDAQAIALLTSQGKTPIFLAKDKQLVAIFGVADTIKDNVKEAIAELHRLGLKAVMLTGDNKNTAEYIASLVGIDVVKAEVLPHQKADVIRELQAQ